MAMAAPPRCVCFFVTSDTVPLVPVQPLSSGAVGHNRGGVVETPLLGRTQGRTACCTKTSTHALLQGGF